jgi:hypothetical protein
MSKECKIDGCNNKVSAKGLCQKHYMASITYNKKTEYLGVTKDFDEAVRWREEKEKELGWLEKSNK